MEKSIESLARRWLRSAAGETEARVLKSAIEHSTLSRDTNVDHARVATFGERLADDIARIGGSWGFIIAFLLFLVVWTVANVWLLTRDAFDPYPFVFLNLILSMLAAIQAPIIMMSQNRQAARDRRDAEHDYEVNLKAEIEIMALHEKLDELRHKEIIVMRTEVSEIAARLAKIEARLSKR